MISIIDIAINASTPWMPLAEFAAFVGSPSQIRVRGIPAAIGNWSITKVYGVVSYPDNTVRTVELSPDGVATGEVGVQSSSSREEVYHLSPTPTLLSNSTLLTATFPGSAAVGSNAKGFQIIADGIDETGAAVTGYCLGVGPLRILSRDGTITIGETAYYYHYLDSVPTTPHKGDACIIDGVLKWYNGTSWQPFANIPDISGLLPKSDVVAPSTNPADAGKAADAKATGDALAAKLSRAEAEAGFTLWTVKRNGVDVTSQVSQPTYIPEDHAWETVFLPGDLAYTAYVPGTTADTSLEWTGQEFDPETGPGSTAYYAATRTRLRPTKTSQLTNDGSDGQHPFLTEHQSLANYATKADATLTPIYSGNGQRFSAWTCEPAGPDASDPSKVYTVVHDDLGGWSLFVTGSDDIVDHIGMEDETILFFSHDGDEVTATRTENPIIGYTLGDQATKPLQPKGDYAPATNIAKSALSSAVQASLGLADTAVQPSALTSAVRYDLGEVQTIATAETEWIFSPEPATDLHYEVTFDTATWTLYSVSNSDPESRVAVDAASGTASDATVIFTTVDVTATLVTYGSATLADRTANYVQITAAIAELRIAFPAAVSGKVRDFGLRVEVGTGVAALTAPGLVIVASPGENPITPENPDGEMPALADGAADTQGVTLLYFSETSPGVFLVKGEEVKEVA